MPSPSVMLSVGTVLTALSSTAFAAQYEEKDVFNGRNWLEAFEFKQVENNFGFVNYVNEATAKSMELYKTHNDDVIFGVDGTETLDPVKDVGRKSVRLEGKTNYNKGLFILDVKQMPGVCGMWPAFWSLGQGTWPATGEIDIIENINDSPVNKYVLHTDIDCKVSGLGQSNPQGTRDCALQTGGTAGCDVNEVRKNSFGKNFNDNGGGYYVMEWASDAIKTWFFPRNSELPATLLTAQPDTSKFGPPAANFQGDCNIDERFKDQRFIFTNNFCGEWAGNAFGTTPGSTCPLQKDEKTGQTLSPIESCKKYVAKNPDIFKNQFWKIGSFKTYGKKVVASSSSSASMSRSSSVVSSSIRVSSSMSSTKASSSLVSSTRASTSASSTRVSSSSVSSTRVSSSSSRSSTRASSSSASSTRASSSTASRTRMSSPPSASSTRSASNTPASSSASISSTRINSSSSASSTRASSFSSSTQVSSSASSTHVSSSVSVPVTRISSSASASNSQAASAASSTRASSSSALVSNTPVGSSSTRVSSTPLSLSSHAVSSSVISSNSAHVTGTPSISASASSFVVASSSTIPSSSAAASSHANSVSSVVIVSSSVALGSSSTDIHVPTTTPADVHSSSPIEHATSSSAEAHLTVSSSYHPGQSSSAVYPSSSGAVYTASSSSSASVYYYGSNATVPVYGDEAKSTSCTTSSAKETSSAPVYAASAPVYGDKNPSYPVNSVSVKKNDYPYLPSFTPVTPIYPDTTSAPVYGGGEEYKPLTTITTTYATTYVDVCETGYTTKTTTFAVTYAPMTTPTSGKPTPPPAYGWDVTTKVCQKGCGEGVKTVTVTVPCTKCNYVATPTPVGPAPGKPTPVVPVPGKPTPAVPVVPGTETITTKVYQTKIITLSKVPVPEAPKSKPAEVPVVSKPVVPAYGTSVVAMPSGKPVGAKNGTVSVSVGTATPSKTGYAPPVFTGSASSLQSTGLVAVIGAAVAMLLL